MSPTVRATVARLVTEFSVLVRRVPFAENGDVPKPKMLLIFRLFPGTKKKWLEFLFDPFSRQIHQIPIAHHQKGE